MESHNIETLIEKYFDGETSLAEETQLQEYFSSSDVAQHLEQYRPMFGYFAKEREQRFDGTLPLQPRKRKTVAWLSVAASVAVLLGVGTFAYNNLQNQTTPGELGTYDDPEKAFAETQKALDMLAAHVNTGVESVEYINEYEESKDLVFKK
ncbi:hypothetical protein HUK80_13865 [Flavobacterium sp. MAH-1]|uniref:Uncharacterized protein n=1 Tax=Flavobacterium agri TaxID=2743471 RepID=A0A7Y8Y465_9FLAO|nr:hypothetical protein [Flavobacterium agri]NUY81986.1 hypothetical protein [Flavobacterium agri]NYA72010.1 hypothetical protein [Flavobacterium agri]